MPDIVLAGKRFSAPPQSPKGPWIFYSVSSPFYSVYSPLPYPSRFSFPFSFPFPVICLCQCSAISLSPLSNVQPSLCLLFLELSCMLAPFWSLSHSSLQYTLWNLLEHSYSSLLSFLFPLSLLIHVDHQSDLQYSFYDNVFSQATFRSNVREGRLDWNNSHTHSCHAKRTCT